MKKKIILKNHQFPQSMYSAMMEFRLKLAKSIGYDKIPALDPTAFDRLKGLFADEIESEYF